MNDRTAYDSDARLVEDIRTAPDDDAPRLVWADAVGGERGEFVVIQVDLARGDLTPDEALARKRRQRDLLARHGEQWSGLAGLATRVSFDRGFVDAAEVSGEVLVDQIDDVLAAAPGLTALTVTGVPNAVMFAQVCALPALKSLRGLDVGLDTSEDIGGAAPGDVVLGILAHYRLLDRLHAFGVRDRVTMTGMQTLIESTTALERLWLRYTSDAIAINRLLAAGRLDRLRAFDRGRGFDPVGVELPRGLTELHVPHLGADSIPTLAASAATIEHLVADTAVIDLAPYVAFPRLQTLAIRQPILQLNTRLHTQRVLALRELSVTGAINEQIVRMIVEQLGPQLELLDLRNSPAALRFVNELSPHVRGELLVGQRDPVRRLLRTVPTTQLPWWDHVTLG